MDHKRRRASGFQDCEEFETDCVRSRNATDTMLTAAVGEKYHSRGSVGEVLLWWSTVINVI